MGLGRRGTPQALQGVQRQASAALAVGAGAWVYRLAVLQGQERPDLANDLAAGAVGIEDLPEKAPEGAAQRIDALAAVVTLLGLGQQPGRQQGSEELFQVEEVLAAQAVDPLAQGGQAGAPSGEKRRVHDKYIYLSHLDVQLKIIAVNKTLSALGPRKRQYQGLRQRLAQIGYISQGSVLDRSTLSPPRSGYQWTRKVARKTITVSLSREQFQSLKQAVENHRTLRQTLQQMEKLSRQILFGTLPDTRRLKPLGQKVLGLI